MIKKRKKEKEQEFEILNLFNIHEKSKCNNIIIHISKCFT